MNTIYACPYCGLKNFHGLVTPIMLHIEREHPDREIPDIHQLALAAEMRRTRHVWGALSALAEEA